MAMNHAVNEHFINGWALNPFKVTPYATDYKDERKSFFFAIFNFPEFAARSPAIKHTGQSGKITLHLCLNHKFARIIFSLRISIFALEQINFKINISFSKPRELKI